VSVNKLSAIGYSTKWKTNSEK